MSNTLACIVKQTLTGDSMIKRSRVVIQMKTSS